MVKFERMSDADVQKMSKRQSKLDLTEYETYLQTVDIGAWSRIILEPGDAPRTVKRRMTTAVGRSGRGIKYRKAPDGELHFQLLDKPREKQKRGPRTGIATLR